MTWFSVTSNKDSLASTEPVGTHTFGVPLGWPEYQTWCLVLELIAKSEVHRMLTMANSSSQPFNQPTDSGALKRKPYPCDRYLCLYRQAHGTDFG